MVHKCYYSYFKEIFNTSNNVFKKNTMFLEAGAASKQDGSESKPWSTDSIPGSYSDIYSAIIRFLYDLVTLYVTLKKIFSLKEKKGNVNIA